MAELTIEGIEYCEFDSYTNFGQAIVTNNYNISINHSPNSNIVNQSSHVFIDQKFKDANVAVKEIKKEVENNKTIDETRAIEILECLNEIQLSLNNQQKPKFAVKSLIDIIGGIASITSWVTVLGQFAGVIPIPGG